MFLIAKKNLFQEKLKFIISAAGISFSIMLMFLLLGIYYGMSDQFVRYSTENTADIVITQKGVKDMFIGVSLINNSDKIEIDKIQGVEKSLGVLQIKAFYENNSKKSIVTLTTYDAGNDLGAPWGITEGRNIRNDNEIVLGKDFAKKHNLKLGELITLNDSNFKVVGLIDKSSFINAYYGFITTNKGQELLGIPNHSNFIFVKAVNPSAVDNIIRKIENINPNLNIVRKDEFIRQNKEVLEETFLPIVFAIVLVGFMVGTAIIGITIYTSTIDKQIEYGVLKAIGTSNFQLYKLLCQQALILSLFGIIIGVVLTIIGRELLSLFISHLEVKIDIGISLLIIVLTIIMSLLSVFIPARKIANIDPALVFKS